MGPPSRPTAFFSFLFQKTKTKNQKNGTTYGKPWGGTDAFLAPWKQKNCQKKRSTRAWFFFKFKDGVARQKSAHKNFIKKVVVWGFFSRWWERKDGEGMAKRTMKKMCVFPCTLVWILCVWEYTNVCKCVWALAIWTFQAEQVTAGRKKKKQKNKKQNWDISTGQIETR